MDLLEKARQSLPLPPTLLSSKSKAHRSSPEKIILLGIKYEQMLQTDAWLDFWEQMEHLKSQIEAQILAGGFDEKGDDLTPLARATLRMLISVMTIPEIVRRLREQEEAMEGMRKSVDSEVRMS